MENKIIIFQNKIQQNFFKPFLRFNNQVLDVEKQERNCWLDGPITMSKSSHHTIGAQRDDNAI